MATLESFFRNVWISLDFHMDLISHGTCWVVTWNQTLFTPWALRTTPSLPHHIGNFCVTATRGELPLRATASSRAPHRLGELLRWLNLLASCHVCSLLVSSSWLNHTSSACSNLITLFNPIQLDEFLKSYMKSHRFLNIHGLVGCHPEKGIGGT